MPAGIFISYRRDESRHAAGRLADDLSQAFGAESIFRDIEGIEPGLDFTQSLEKALGSCVVMLVLIGPQWLQIQDGQGRRRLDQAGDWIRQEIATALARDVRVVPILLEGATLPEVDDLPEDLKPLVRRQALDMSDVRWRGDLQRLVDTLARVPGLERRGPQVNGPAPPPEPKKSVVKPALIGAGATLIVLMVVGYMAEDKGTTSSEGPTPAPAPLPVQEAVPGPAPTIAPTPAPSPAAAPARVPAPEPALPNVAGLWRTNTGETYHFNQSGAQVEFTAQAGGQVVGSGSGQFEGALLRLAFTIHVNGAALGSANCDMQPAPDQRSYTGMCMGPNGPFAAQFFR